MKINSHNFIKVIIISYLFNMFSCKENKNILYGNWSWVSENNKYYEVLIDSTEIIGYRHAFLYPREYKIVKDSLFMDKINFKKYALTFKIKFLKDGNILLKSTEGGNITLYKIKDNSFTIDSIKNDDDIDRYELEYTTRKEKWKRGVN